MLTSNSRLPVSTANALLVGVFLLAAAATAVAGRWAEAAMLALIGLIGMACALYARRPNSRDITRINAIEYRDERDKQIAQEGFAVVGAVALVLSVAEFVMVSVLAHQYAWSPVAKSFLAGQLLVLALVWAIANSIAARRG